MKSCYDLIQCFFFVCLDDKELKASDSCPYAYWWNFVMEQLWIDVCSSCRMNTNVRINTNVQLRRKFKHG